MTEIGRGKIVIRGMDKKGNMKDCSNFMCIRKKEEGRILYVRKKVRGE